MKKIIISLLAIVALAACSKEEPQKKENIVKGFEISKEMMKTTTLAEAQKEQIKEQMSFFGKISADRNSYIDIYPLVGGNVLTVNAELGDYVHKGQVLATIRSTEVAGFQKDLSDAKTDLAEAQNKLRVAQELYEGKLNTRNDVMAARSELTKAEDQLKRAEAVSTIYNVRNGNIYSVVSPINGYIVQKNINKDMQLRSDRSDNIFDVANTKDVWALVNINETDIDKIELGMKAEVSTLSYPDKVFYGKIDKIFKIIDPQTNAMQARVVLDNTQGLLIPDSKATIKIFDTLNETAIAIPSSAVIFDDNRYFVVLFRSQSNIKTREIKILKQTGETTYVADGVKEGDKVVTSNQLLIYKSLKE
ncbi:efflux RND transporter periplasmic adaptor subunit [Elizabethkingia meningoseptica]|uniref:efflux RND transporter periplasmic adaptor subunit n=2 Tax=Elizabethkingia meningoseptica TaxID=238 RepID=UPI0008412D0E|nr:efflux RND transporter periplasmic adaptor subunit [Elizabethkingia meningoseptica]EJK5327799.1 efflux RND transporter periplasmic adaptor subunit [Elizabethkingia meningoseptica]MDE5436326.1 efflux RND transporter periplasmic adaptor subunit [Elizabethkingia meningoseptica]MDE5467437.1 efflux RND transporter periplasmic adaptor subunit [Elizabethkingia meningoseptica]MDE5473333.1 efflux RND transporter periplasmic adaptor subunit [Elizabethkingia meningoseptica]MDE5476766.1 efflux RND tran